MLKLPTDELSWVEINEEFVSHPEIQSMCNDLQRDGLDASSSRESIQTLVNRAADCVSGVLFAIFSSRGLVKKRSFGHCDATTAPNHRHSAPAEFRALRKTASRAASHYQRCVRDGAEDSIKAAAKHEFNKAAKRCRQMSRRVRKKFCLDWSASCARMRRSSPKSLWRSFRAFTSTPSEESSCPADVQWEHWASQGHITEDV